MLTPAPAREAARGAGVKTVGVILAIALGAGASNHARPVRRSAAPRRRRSRARRRRVRRADIGTGHRPARGHGRRAHPGRARRASVIGIGGLAKTIVGFLAGIVGTQFIVAQPLPRFVVFFGATVLHAIVFMGLYVVLDLRHFGTPYDAAGRRLAGRRQRRRRRRGVPVVELLPGAVDAPTASARNRSETVDMSIRASTKIAAASASGCRCCSTSITSCSRCSPSASGCCRSCSTRSSRSWPRTTTSGRWRCARRAASCSTATARCWSRTATPTASRSCASTRRT